MAQAEQAMQSFEAMTGLAVVLHDVRHCAWLGMDWGRLRHRHPLCQRVKQGPEGHRCVAFEVERLRADAARWRWGRVHRCHAGLLEMVQPIFDEQGLLFMVFAGPFRLDETDLIDVDTAPSAAHISDQSELPVLERDQVPHVQELLRQLGARLRCLQIDRELGTVDRDAEPRRLRIEYFIQQHYAEQIGLQDLAEALHLSVDRCRHAVRESCGQGFATLLRAHRLKASCAMLLNTDLAVSEVAQRCGLPDASGFTRAFRGAFGLSPGRWRKHNRG